MRENESTINTGLIDREFETALNEASRLLSRKWVATLSRTHGRRVVNDPIYARIGRIRPLGHHGPLYIYIYIYIFFFLTIFDPKVFISIYTVVQFYSIAWEVILFVHIKSRTHYYKHSPFGIALKRWSILLRGCGINHAGFWLEIWPGKCTRR